MNSSQGTMVQGCRGNALTVSPLVFITLALALACAPAMSDQLDTIKARGKLVCGVLGGFEPFGFRNPDTGEVSGYEPDICNGIAKHLGVKSELKVITSQGRVPELQQGRVDVEAALLGWSKERDDQVDYSNVYAVVDSKMMVMKDSGVKGPDDLLTKRIGVVKGSLLEFIGRNRFPKATMIAFDDTPAAYLALRQGKISGLLVTEPTLNSLKSLDPDGDKALILPEIYDSSQVPVAVGKGETRLRDEINVFLARFEASGEAMKLFNKWFGSDSKLKMTRRLAVGAPINRN